MLLLKKSRPFVAQLSEILPQKNKLNGERKEIQKRVGELKKEIQVKSNEVDNKRAELDSSKNLQADIKEKLDNLEAQI